jgi:cell shape-determining protein MreC
MAQALVIDDPNAASIAPILDRGRDAAIAADRLVLAGSRVWGKVAEVGQHTCTVKRTTDAGYRDLVQLATPREDQLQFVARGVLVGQGTLLCKIEQVETTEPIAIGDLAFTVDDGVVDAPLLYGRVVRLGRKPGQAHWEIWLEPAVPAALPPAHVAVLKMELNPTRIAVVPQ